MKLFDEIKPVFFIDNKMNNILNDINVKLKKINVTVFIFLYYIGIFMACLYQLVVYYYLLYKKIKVVRLQPLRFH